MVEALGRLFGKTSHGVGDLDRNGYWSITVYSMDDRYLIPNPRDRYSITSYTATANSDGTYTVRINPDGKGENATPTMKKLFYAVMRVYQPEGTVEFPPIKLETKISGD